MIIASLTDPGAVEIASWIACLFFLVAGWNQVEQWMERRKDKPAAHDVRAELVDKFTTKEAFNQQVADNKREHENIFAKLGGIERGLQARMDERLRDISKEFRDSAEGIHERVNDVLRAVSRLEGKLEERDHQ